MYCEWYDIVLYCAKTSGQSFMECLILVLSNNIRARL